MMKRIAPAVLFSLVPFFAACESPPLTPEQQATVAELDAARMDQLERAEKARAEGRVADAQNHEAAAKALDAQAAEVEAKAATESWGAVLGSLGDKLPWPFKGAPELVLPFVPLFFKRPRKHFANAAKALNPFNMSVPPGQAIDSILKAYGLKHSTPDSEAVAEGKAKATPSEPVSPS
jgi:hypothetical protein